jgi:hypothetical protein
MDEWQVHAFLALVTLSMMAPCLFTATTARMMIQRPGSGPGASAATCHGSGSNTFFEYMQAFVSERVAYNVYSLHDTTRPRTQQLTCRYQIWNTRSERGNHTSPHWESPFGQRDGGG